uniref:Zn(2)-C6 fungal-type domain-containing protein n=1 Tax=Bionectria ochroleuca TaxID=29856 RepID=A0A8H7K3U0_BIOOC
MPRLACSSCRASKVRCKVKENDTSCVRCLSRNTPCSYTQHVRSVRSLPQNSLPDARPAASPQVQTDLSKVPAAYQLLQENHYLDFGRGHPEDILRENEFAFSLVLLYFSNFNDIHFMFDEEAFLRDFRMGDVPPIILYSMMALSIRFSLAPFGEELPPRHRGEPLWRHARNLLKDSFDWPSTTAIQVYVLLSTYKLSFGGSRQAYLYLGYASNMLRALRFMDSNFSEVSVQMESRKRLAYTVALMDRLMFPLKLPSQFEIRDDLPEMRSEESFWILKKGGDMSETFTNRPSPISVEQEIFKLSSMLVAVCDIYLGRNLISTLDEAQENFERYSNSRHPLLFYTNANLELQESHDNLRKFAYMHLLYHHVGQILCFRALKSVKYDAFPSSGDDQRYSLQALTEQCYGHASVIVRIITHCSERGFDIHNFSFGQILTVSTVILSHALFWAESPEAAEQLQGDLKILLECVERLKNHTRMFLWVLQHLANFTKVRNQNRNTWIRIVDQNTRILSQMLFLGSQWETMEPTTGARRPGLGSLPITSEHLAGSRQPIIDHEDAQADETTSQMQFSPGSGIEWMFIS